MSSLFKYLVQIIRSKHGSDLQNLEREKNFDLSRSLCSPFFPLSLLIVKNTKHEELSSARNKRRRVAEEAINDEGEERRVVEEERRERFG